MRECLSCRRLDRWPRFAVATALMLFACFPASLMALPLPGVSWSSVYGFTSGSFSDESGNGNTLSAFTGSPGFVADRNGSSSSAFQGSTGRILGKSGALAGFNPASNQLSLSAWIKTTSVGSELIVSMGRSSSSFEGEWIWGISSGKLYFWDYQGGNGFPATFTSTASVNNGQWRHVAFVRNGLTGTFYVDGIPSGSMTAAKNVSYANIVVALGGDYRDNNGFWTGSLDDLSISSTALTPAQVLLLSADASVPGVETGPTNSISGLTQTSVKLMGGITNLGGTTVTNAGFYLNTNSTATNGVKYSAPGTSFGLGSFSNTITGLTPGTSYYYRAFAANSVGTGYGANEYSFTTPSPSPFTYTTSTTGVTITGYTGTGGVVEIPATIGGLPVTEIGNYAFQSKSNLTAVIIPSGVTTIGANAFADCANLASVSLPISLTHIKSGAFFYCPQLATISIPSAVNTIEYNAFLNCSTLTVVNFEGSHPPMSIEASAFLGLANGAVGYYPATASAAWQGVTIAGLTLTPYGQVNHAPVILSRFAVGFNEDGTSTAGWTGVGANDTYGPDKPSFSNGVLVATATGSSSLGSTPLMAGTYTVQFAHGLPFANAAPGTLTVSAEAVANGSSTTLYTLGTSSTLTLRTDTIWTTDSFTFTIPNEDPAIGKYLKLTFNHSAENVWHGFDSVSVFISGSSTLGIPALIEDVTGNLLFSSTPFSDVDSSSLTVTLSVDAGTITGNAGTGITVGGTATARTFAGTLADLNAYFITAGKITYLAPQDFNGSKTLGILVSDGQLDATGSATINVQPSNDAPVLAEILSSYSGGFNQPQTIPLVASDVETPVGDLVFTASSNNQSLFPNGNLEIHGVISSVIGGSLGSTTSGGGISPIGNTLGGGSEMSWELVATPATGQSGEADITVTVTDGGGALASRTFHITVLDAYTTWANQYFGQIGENTLQTADPDGDGATNQQEFAAGTNPNDANSHPVFSDTDGDGLNDVQEATLGTNPLLADTDGDGANDKLEVDLGNSPTVANVYNRLINGSFEDGTVKPSPGGWRPVPQNDVPGWKTTANNSYTIELWYSGFLGSSGNDGNTLAELNYNASGTLYQDVTMTVNSPVSYSFLHRGRDGSDVMDFKIDELSGGPGTSVAKNKFTREVSTGTSWVRYSGSQATEVEAGKTYRFSYTSISPTGGNGNLLDDASFGIDQDGDGLTDSVETNTGTYVSANNTGTNPSNPDSDNDGLKDGEEVITYGTNPLLADTDGDGAPDGVEVTAGTNPKQNSSLPKPVITLQPVSITNTVGGGVTFQVTATNPAGSPSALTYQWYKNGTAIPAGTNPNLIILPLTIAEAGNYSVVVSNSYGAVTSSIASLTVNKANPIITVAPTAAPIAYGQTLAFSTLSGGEARIGITRGSEGTLIPGTFAFSNTTSVPAAGTSGQNVIFTPSDTANYNTVETSVSVTVNKATPTISVAPMATSIGYGQTLAFSILSGGSGSVAGTFAWTTPSTSPNAGTASQSVTFTPTDTANYNTVTTSVNVTVNKATPTIMVLPGFMSATGGTISESGDFIIHTFRNVGSYTFQPMGSDTVEILVVAGGGGAGYDGGGGGGAGGVITNTVSVTAGTDYTVVVGGGGAAAAGPQSGANGSSGSNSQFGSVTAIGGAGGYNGHAGITAITTGGSGGGEGFTGGGPGNGTPGQGNRGGYKFMDSAGGGGGGAGEVGGNASNGRGGNGGKGIQSDISGVATWYGGGGAGGSWNGTGGTGGMGGGGNGGGRNATAGANGIANTGGGGGGNGYASSSDSGMGGSGVVIVRYKPKILTYGQSIGEATFSGATASVPGTFAFANPSATPAAGNNSLSVIFTPTDTASYETVTTSVLVFVAQATPTVISNPTSTAIGYGQTLGSSTLSGGVASVPGTFAFSNPASAPETGTSIQSVIFTPSDRVNYNAVTVPVEVMVSKATPIITASPTATSIGYGQLLGSSTLGGGIASVPGSFAWTTPSTSPNAGTTSQGVTFTPADKANYNTVTTSVSVTVNKAMPSITTAPTATPIAYGQTLAFSTLSGGAADVPGSFAFSNPTSGPATGTSSQNVIFTPIDTLNYNTATIPVNVTVNPALISSGFSHTLYLGAGDSTVTAWGLNTDGRLGVGDMNSPVNWAKAVQGIPTGATVDGLSAGGTHSLILAGQKVYAAGSDRYGQLGQGAVNGANKTSFTPVAMPSIISVAIAAGGNHSLVVTADGKVFACGDNTYGQLGQPASVASLGTFSEVTTFPPLTKIVSVAAGADHNLAVDENGGVWVWGRNDSGQLGKNTRTLGAVADRTPVQIISSGAKSVAAGYAHSLVLKQDGTVLGFGRNTLGQTGQSSGTSYARLPTPISGLSGIRSIAAGTDSSFAVDQAGQLRSWGYNAYGELLLGYASPISSPAVYGPTPSPIATNVSNVAGGGYSSLAVGAQGVIFGGRNDVGQAGNGPDPDQVVGDYYFEAGNLPLTNLTMDLAGTTETLYDQIFVGNGAATLNGILNLMFVGTYTGPVYGSTQTFDLIWAKNGVTLGTGYQLAFNQAGYLAESAVVDKSVEGVSGKVLQATVRAVVTAADLAKAVSLARPSLDQVQSVSYGGSTGVEIRTLSVSSGVEMIYSYERPTGGVISGAEYFVNGFTYRVEQSSSSPSGPWLNATVSGTTVTPLGNGYERATLRISASGTVGFLHLSIGTPQATGINAGLGNAITY